MPASQFTLYSHRGPGPNPGKVAILLEYLGLSYEVVPLVFGDDPKTGVKGEFLKLNPNGRVPALIDHKNNDFVVWESGAILYYLAEKYGAAYLGNTVEEKTVVMQWLTHQLSGLGPVQGNLNWAIHYWENAYGEKPCKSVFTRFEGESHRLYQVLEDQLERQAKRGSTYICLDRPTVADFAFYSWVNIAGFGKLDISKYAHVNKWLAHFQNDARVKAAYAKLPTS